MTRIGMLVRAEDRGLGLQTWEAYRALRPDLAIVVKLTAGAGDFPLHLDRYPDGELVTLDLQGQMPEARVRGLLERIDVLYTVETLYDWRLVEWARAAGVRTVVHLNPEFYKHATEDLAEPDEWWAPTPWRLEHLPPARLMPVPIAGDRFPLTPAPADGVLRVLHVVGHRAIHDRNGTEQLLKALREVRAPMKVRLITQDGHVPKDPRMSSSIELEVVTGGVEHYWQLYADADVLVMPRRFGGLCLPVQEAMASGLGVVMTDVAPNDWWPTLRVSARTARDFNSPAGIMRLADAHPGALAELLDVLASEPAEVLAMKRRSVEWAQAHTWTLWADRYRRALVDAAA